MHGLAGSWMSGNGRALRTDFVATTVLDAGAALLNFASWASPSFLRTAELVRLSRLVSEFCRSVANHLARVFRTWAEPNVERTHLTHWCLVDLLTGISLGNLFR